MVQPVGYCLEGAYFVVCAPRTSVRKKLMPSKSQEELSVRPSFAETTNFHSSQNANDSFVNVSEERMAVYNMCESLFSEFPRISFLQSLNPNYEYKQRRLLARRKEPLCRYIAHSLGLLLLPQCPIHLKLDTNMCIPLRIYSPAHN